VYKKRRCKDTKAYLAALSIGSSDLYIYQAINVRTHIDFIDSNKLQDRIAERERRPSQETAALSPAQGPVAAPFGWAALSKSVLKSPSAKAA